MTGKELVVLGGGVAGVCCAQELCRICPDAHVTLISADAVIKVRLQIKVTSSKFLLKLAQPSRG
jgi:NADH dehydrogenase FAD-containing subunit